ncbi:MAG: hypothetical protein AB7G28_17200 [Pirellulales bacterium]
MGAILKQCDFVQDGHGIACAAIRRQVKQEYAERWKLANWRERLRLRAEIKVEVRRRIARLAPPDALYMWQR